MRMFDLYDQIEDLVKSASEDAFDKVDQSFADVLLRGWSASSYTDVFNGSSTATCPDGVMLFNASHTNGLTSKTFSNVITYGTVNPVLSREAVVAARKQGMTFKDPNGHVRPVNLDTLLVPPSLYDDAMRICESDRMNGTGDNDVNPLKGKVKVQLWERLETRTDGTDCGAYWFMYDSSKVGNSLKAKFAERPSLDAPEQVYKNKNWDYTIDFYYTIGRGWPAFIYGSSGKKE